MPYKSSSPKIARWSHDTLVELHEHKNPRVEILPIVILKKNFTPQAELPEWTKHPLLNFRQHDLTDLGYECHAEKLRVPNDETLCNAGYSHAWRFESPVTNCPDYLSWLEKEVRHHPLATVDLGTKKFYQSIEEMREEARGLGCGVLVNCTGLAAAQICGDKSMVPGRGVILHYDRTAPRRRDYLCGNEKDVVITVDEPPWGSSTKPCYIIPRGDVLVVGGTFLENDKEKEVRPKEREELENNAYLMGVDTNKIKSQGEWVGYRPYRPDIRVELDDSSQDVKVVHNYGHGGSGWTLFVGTAKEAAQIVEEHI